MSEWKYCLTDKLYSWASGVSVKDSYIFKDSQDCAKLCISKEGVISVYDNLLRHDTKKPKMYYASLVRDVLYQFKDHPDMPYSRQIIDWVYLDILKHAGIRLSYFHFLKVKFYGAFIRD